MSAAAVKHTAEFTESVQIQFVSVYLVKVDDP